MDDWRADAMADVDEARLDALVEARMREYDDFDYDAALDAAHEYESSVIEKGIRDQVDGRAREYLSRRGDAVWERIDPAIREAEALLEEHPRPSLILTMTATELLVRFMLVRPMLAGVVLDVPLADRLAAEAIRGFGGRERELLPHLCRLWDIELGEMRVEGGGELLPTLGTLAKARDRAVHRGRTVSVEEARLALASFLVLGRHVLGKLVIRLGMKWPEEKWLLPFDLPEDPLADR